MEIGAVRSYMRFPSWPHTEPIKRSTSTISSKSDPVTSPQIDAAETSSLHSTRSQVTEIGAVRSYMRFPSWPNTEPIRRSTSTLSSKSDPVTSPQIGAAETNEMKEKLPENRETTTLSSQQDKEQIIKLGSTSLLKKDQGKEYLSNNGNVMCQPTDDSDDSETPTPWHTTFKDIPVMLENRPGEGGFTQTCTLDPGLMIIVYQMMTNKRLLTYFSRDHRKFVKNLLELFLKKKFEALRWKWAEMINYTKKNFYGTDKEIIMPPISKFLSYKHISNCTKPKCIENTEEDIWPAKIKLRCLSYPKFLDSKILQNLINDFEKEERRPCDGHITQPDGSHSRCTGTLRIKRKVAQAPVIILNMQENELKRKEIGYLDDTVQISGRKYYIGGATFNYDQHFTARIKLRCLDNITLFYDNIHGVKVVQNYSLEPDDAVLSLLFLFREE